MIDALALLCTTAGLVVGLVVLVTRRDALLGLRIGLDFWLAAALLRLAGPVSWQRIAAAAAIASLRIALARRLRAPGSQP